MELYVASNNLREYLIHEIAFYYMVAQAVGNPIPSASMTWINTAIYNAQHELDRRSEELHKLLERYLNIFRAIRDHKLEEAGRAMEDYLQIARRMRQQYGPQERMQSSLAPKLDKEHIAV